ncbi:MAG: ATP-binding cassette domain-containing protein [Sphingomonadales bacterium]|nr:MAG: ATP-binding cassette domain-containing protein [Sphingomonadales bacterium]
MPNEICATEPSGRILFDGQAIDKLPAEHRASLGLAYSPEGRKLWPAMSIEDNILAAMPRLSAAQRCTRYEELSQLFPMLAERRNMMAGLLSGGQQQIVAVARAMAMRSKLLLLDEPFLGLAPVWIEQISAAIRSARKDGITVLMAEQMARPALKLADYGYVLRAGQIRNQGPVSALGEAVLAGDYL